MEKSRLFTKGGHVLVISPHCDDAAFSLGGIIEKYSRRGVRFTILTCFSMSNYTVDGTDTSINSVTLLRKKEDNDFFHLCKRSNIAPLYLDLPEAPLRKGRDSSNIFSTKLTEHEIILAQKLGQKIYSLLDDNTLLLYPASIGVHVDHFIARQACQYIIKKHSNHMQYADLPYASLINDIKNTIYKHFSKVEVFSIDDTIKKNILACYPSQLSQKQIKSILSFDFKQDDGTTKEILFR